MASLFSVRKAKYNLLEVEIARKIRKILNFDLKRGKSTAFSFFYFLSLPPPLLPSLFLFCSSFFLNESLYSISSFVFVFSFFFFFLLLFSFIGFSGIRSTYAILFVP